MPFAHDHTGRSAPWAPLMPESDLPATVLPTSPAPPMGLPLASPGLAPFLQELLPCPSQIAAGPTLVLWHPVILSILWASVSLSVKRKGWARSEGRQTFGGLQRTQELDTHRHSPGTQPYRPISPSLGLCWLSPGAFSPSAPQMHLFVSFHLIISFPFGQATPPSFLPVSKCGEWIEGGVWVGAEDSWVLLDTLTLPSDPRLHPGHRPGQQ